MQLSDIDLCDQDAYAAGGPPHDQFRFLRENAPVFRMPGNEPLWAITRYDDVFKASLDQATFSSARAGVVPRAWKPEEFEAQQGILINMDPPRHTKYRKLVSLTFSAKQIRRLEPHVREVANQIIDGVAERGECDFVADIACELPLQVIVELMGVPAKDRHKVLDWSNKMIGFDDPEYQANPETGNIASAELFMYAHQLAEQRLAAPKDDVVSLLLSSEVDGDRLSVVEFNSFFMLLAVAGNETTRNLISGGMLTLTQHPEQYRRLVADPSLLPTAVEEMLRWVTPVNQFRRTATRDAEIGGQAIRDGEKIVLFYSSANRDERHFPDADRFDVGRTPNEHLAFGIGPHFCLGANLARLEIQIMFEELLRRLPDLQLNGKPERLRSNFINGIKRMPMTFTPERGRRVATG